MVISPHLIVYQKALEVLQRAASDVGLKASSEKKDNYDRIWARDTSVAGLVILSLQLKELYPALKRSLLLLQASSTSFGQIPSNIGFDAQGHQQSSFGSSVGRTDTSFWWIITGILFIRQEQDHEFEEMLRNQCHTIFDLSCAWEFNAKHLMYLPMSGNWADEYTTHGYVLYDQILRYWAFSLAGNYFNELIWKEKALKIKIAIKQHFLLETELDDSLFTSAQRARLANFDLSREFIASFSPGDFMEVFDFWSIALLFMLEIPSKRTQEKLLSAIKNIFAKCDSKGLPAFWPIIQESSPLYNSLLLNHRYNFKNKPGHFHNGGIWPVINGFLVTGLTIAGHHDFAKELFHTLHQKMNEALTIHPFPEYFDLKEILPQGVPYLCFSAAGYLMGQQAFSQAENSKIFFQLNPQQSIAVKASLLQTANEIFRQIDMDKENVYVIGITGESGSGKTTLSLALKEVFEENYYGTLILHQDDYFHLPPQKNHLMRLQDFSRIGPQEVRLDLLDEHICRIKSGKEHHIEVPVMNWSEDTEESRLVNLENVKVILVEGTYVSLLKHVDYRIFIDIHYKQTRHERIHRNRETVTDFIEKVLEKESEIIQLHQKNADALIFQNRQIQYNKNTSL